MIRNGTTIADLFALGFAFFPGALLFDLRGTGATLGFGGSLGGAGSCGAASK